jgi:hypothetical protein
MDHEEKNTENMKRCPHFEVCSQSFCPLDFDLDLRSGKKNEKCRYMREAKTSNINGREFVSGGRVMLDTLLKCVPESNVEWLNKASKIRWSEI